jgi:dephospho-CoA kinase
MIYGLTGGIGMGKTSISEVAHEMGIPVWNADEEVHRLYRDNFIVLNYMMEHYPQFVDINGDVDRAPMAEFMFAHPEDLNALNAVIRGQLDPSLQAFIAEPGDRILDVPLLFENGVDRYCDRVIVVSCPPDIQRARCLARPFMTPEKLDNILSKQLTDSERRNRADYVIDTSTDFETSEAAFRAIFA